MIARKFRIEDAERVQAIFDIYHRGQFGMPKLDFTVSSVVVEENGMILAFGALERFLEGTLILDLSLPLKMKLEALSYVIDSGKVAARLAGYERFYISPTPDKFGKLLKRHFDFKECDPYYHLEVR